MRLPTIYPQAFLHGTFHAYGKRFIKKTYSFTHNTNSALQNGFKVSKSKFETLITKNLLISINENSHHLIIILFSKFEPIHSQC